MAWDSNVRLLISAIHLAAAKCCSVLFGANNYP